MSPHGWEHGEARGPTVDPAGENPFAGPCGGKALPVDRHPPEHRGWLSRCPPRRGTQRMPEQPTKVWSTPRALLKGTEEARRGDTMGSRSCGADDGEQATGTWGGDPQQLSQAGWQVETHHSFTGLKKVSLC